MIVEGMIRICFGAIAAIAVVGCASTQALSGDTPFFTGQAAGQPASVVACIAERWSATKNFKTGVRSRDGVTEVVLSGGSVAGADMVASVTKSGSVTMRKRRAAWGSLDDRLRDAVANCTEAAG